MHGVVVYLNERTRARVPTQIISFSVGNEQASSVNHRDTPMFEVRHGREHGWQSTM